MLKFLASRPALLKLVRGSGKKADLDPVGLGQFSDSAFWSSPRWVWCCWCWAEAGKCFCPSWVPEEVLGKPGHGGGRWALPRSSLGVGHALSIVEGQLFFQDFFQWLYKELVQVLLEWMRIEWPQPPGVVPTRTFQKEAWEISFFLSVRCGVRLPFFLTQFTLKPRKAQTQPSADSYLQPRDSRGPQTGESSGTTPPPKCTAWDCALSSHSKAAFTLTLGKMTLSFS